MTAKTAPALVVPALYDVKTRLILVRVSDTRSELRIATKRGAVRPLAKNSFIMDAAHENALAYAKTLHATPGELFGCAIYA